MKKFSIILLIILLISGCSNQDETWKEVHVANAGSLKIPYEWVYNEKDGVMYLTNKNMDDSSECKIYLIGMTYNEHELEPLYRCIAPDMKYVKLISSETFSNSAIIGKNEYIINGQTYEKLFLNLYSSEKELYFIVLDNSIEYETVKKIARSFKMNP